MPTRRSSTDLSPCSRLRSGARLHLVTGEILSCGPEKTLPTYVLANFSVRADIPEMEGVRLPILNPCHLGVTHRAFSLPGDAGRIGSGDENRAARSTNSECTTTHDGTDGLTSSRGTRYCRCLTRPGGWRRSLQREISMYRCRDRM